MRQALQNYTVPADHRLSLVWIGAGSRCKYRLSHFGIHPGRTVGSEDLSIGCLYLEVNMLGTPRVKTRDNSRQLEATVFIGELMSPKSIATVVIISVCVCLPEIQPGICYGLTIGVVDIACDNQFGAVHAVLI